MGILIAWPALSNFDLARLSESHCTFYMCLMNTYKHTILCSTFLNVSPLLSYYALMLLLSSGHRHPCYRCQISKSLFFTRKVSTSCVILVWRNDRKCKCISRNLLISDFKMIYFLIKLFSYVSVNSYFRFTNWQYLMIERDILWPLSCGRQEY